MRDVLHRIGSSGLFPFGKKKPCKPSVKRTKEKGLITSVRVQVPNGEVSPPDQIDRGGVTSRAV
jgi:hypothetical protein